MQELLDTALLYGLQYQMRIDHCRPAPNGSRYERMWKQIRTNLMGSLIHNISTCG
jgi:hypothetical protein